ncbi:MAG: hypothetical protein WDO24_08700 [Pseudomonadota bacterium]
MLKTIRLIGGMALLGGLGGAHAVAAETYAYKVRHPFYGEIGSYTDKVDRTAGLWHIEGQLRVMVRILGIVLFREEADRSESRRMAAWCRFTASRRPTARRSR